MRTGRHKLMSGAVVKARSSQAELAMASTGSGGDWAGTQCRDTCAPVQQIGQVDDEVSWLGWHGDPGALNVYLCIGGWHQHAQVPCC